MSSVATAAWGQPAQFSDPTKPTADSRTVLGVGNEFLAAGAEAIRAKQYDEGIRLTTLGLERPRLGARPSRVPCRTFAPRYAAKGESDLAIERCTEVARRSTTRTGAPTTIAPTRTI